MLIQPLLINAQPGDPNGDLRADRSPHHERVSPHKQDKDQHRTPLNDIRTDEEITNNCRHRHPQYFTAANAGPENDEPVSWRMSEVAEIDGGVRKRRRREQNFWGRGRSLNIDI